MGLVSLLKKTPTAPLYNLSISIEHPLTIFKESIDFDALLMYARIFFQGNHHVVRNGQLRKGHHEQLHNKYELVFPLGINAVYLSDLPDILLGKSKNELSEPLLLLGRNPYEHSLLTISLYDSFFYIDEVRSSFQKSLAKP